MLMGAETRQWLGSVKGVSMNQVLAAAEDFAVSMATSM
jgi:hypothetical protein